MAIHSETLIYAAVIDFQKFVARAVVNLRRDVKGTYGTKLIDESLWMAVVVRRANIAREAAKVPVFEELIEQVEICQVILRTMRDLRWLPPSAFEASLPLTVSISKQATALRDRFAPAPTPAA